MKPPAGAGKPVPGTGIGTKAAMDDPRCRTGAQYGVYGRWDSSAVGMGPLCVRPFKAGDDNGGATSKGVTKDSIKVVAVLPTAERSSAQALAAQLNNRAHQLEGHVGGRDPRLPRRAACRTSRRGAATST